MQETLETWVWSLGGEDPPEEAMVTHSSILAWKIPRTEYPDGLQSKGSQRVRHDRVTKHKNRLLGLVSLLKVDLLGDSSQNVKLLEVSGVMLFDGKKVREVLVKERC